MSLDLFIRFGPYVECHYDPVETKLPYLRCGNFSCEHEKSLKKQVGGFCNMCGSKLIEDFEIFRGEVNGSKIMDLIIERLYSVSLLKVRNVHYWFANISYPATKKYHHLEDIRGNRIEEIKEINVEEEIRAFSDYFANELVVLKTFYEEVSVKWGFTSYVA